MLLQDLCVSLQVPLWHMVFLCISFCVLGLDSYCLQVSGYFQSPKICIIVNVTFRFFVLSIDRFVLFWTKFHYTIGVEEL